MLRELSNKIFQKSQEVIVENKKNDKVPLHDSKEVFSKEVLSETFYSFSLWHFF